MTSIRNTFALCTVTCLIALPTLCAQERGVLGTTDGVVVTAEQLSVLSPGIDDARARLRALPAAANVYSADDYQLGRRDYLEDFLRYQPGVLISSNQGAEDTHVSSRGSGQNNDDIIGLTILIDGIPINQADGEAYLHDVDLQTVKFAEVYRGADALRYGAVALGGAINLVSMTGREAAPVSVGAAFGSFGYFQQTASSGWSKGPLDVYAAVSDHIQNGYQAHSQENYQKVSFNLGYQISPAMENRFYFYFGRLEQDHPSTLSKDKLYADPRSSDPAAIEQDWSTRWSYYRVMDRFALQGAGWTLQASLSWNHRQVTQRDEYEEDFRLGTARYYSDDYAASVVFESTAECFGRKNRFTVGMLPYFEPESDSYYANADGKIGKLLFADRTYYLNFPVYFENQHYFTKEFSLLTGLQGVYVNRVLRDGYQSPTLGDQSHDDHFWALNPKVGFAYQWNDRSLVYVNASRNFQPVSFDESIGVQEGEDGGQVFRNLYAQRGVTLELGTRGELGPVRWDLVLYRSWVHHELLSLNNDQGTPLGTVNADDTLHQGIEVGIEWELARSLLTAGVRADRTKDAKDRETTRAEGKPDRLVLQQTYNLSDFRFDEDPAYGNHRIAGNPVQGYKAEIRYEHPGGLYFGPNVEWNIVKYPVDEANTLFADPYAILGFRAGYKTAKGFQVYFEAKNVLDKIYAAYVEPIADARVGDDNASFSPGVGRAFYGGVSWSW